MHELSLVLSIIQIAEEQVLKAGAKEVEQIELDIGCLSCVELTALDFAWKAAIPNTVLAAAKKHINLIEGKAECLDCKQIYRINNLYEPCPACGNFCFNILAGQELKVKYVVVS